MPDDFDDFLSSVKYLDRQDILDTAYKKHKALDKHSTSLTTAQRMEFQAHVSDLLFWMEKGERPKNISDQDFLKFKDICENLVKNGELPKLSLQLFK